MNQPIKLILNYKKAAQLSTILQLLKACSETVAFIIGPEFVHIQVMDKAHICLCECRFYYDWFLNAEELTAIPPQQKTGTFVLSTPILHTIVSSINSTEQKLILEFTPTADTFTVDIIYNVTNKESINKHYTLPLSGIEYELMNITETDYVAEFIIGAKTIQDILTQMSVFGNGVYFTCTEEGVNIASSTDNQKGKVEVTVSSNDFEEYAIDEGANLHTEFSCVHLIKYCITTKLVPIIKIHIADNMPMKIGYSLEDDADAAANPEEKSFVRFFITPKISDIDDE